MKKIFFALLLILASEAQAQSTTDPKAAIKSLKNGTLIVNLIHPQRKIEALLQSGYKEDALALEAEVAKENQEIIIAFAENYNFSNLLFVYSYNVGRVADGDATALFSASGNAQSVLPSVYFFVELTESPEKKIKGFLVKDAQRDPLTKPFPYFVAQYEFLHLKKLSYAEMVKNLNDRLSAFYDTAQR